MTNLTHKEMTAHIRKRLKHNGVKALVRMQKGLGNDKIIQVNTPKFNIEFTAEEQATVRQVAKTNGLTWVMGGEIIVDQQTNPQDFNFYM